MLMTVRPAVNRRKAGIRSTPRYQMARWTGDSKGKGNHPTVIQTMQKIQQNRYRVRTAEGTPYTTKSLKTAQDRESMAKSHCRKKRVSRVLESAEGTTLVVVQTIEKMVIP
tara:strand:- start:109 stop:441 length:333 start_codon:yes stop_codon:yes gene_type:complete